MPCPDLVQHHLLALLQAIVDCTYGAYALTVLIHCSALAHSAYQQRQVPLGGQWHYLFVLAPVALHCNHTLPCVVALI